MRPTQSNPKPYQEPQNYNTLAVVSLVSSILAWLVVPLLGSIVGVVCGHLARGQLRIQPHESSSVLALLGLIIGYVQLLLIAAILMVVVFFGWAIFQQV